jgi:hypothetical protein
MLFKGTPTRCAACLPLTPALGLSIFSYEGKHEMSPTWDSLIEKFGIWVVIILICFIGAGIAASSKELLLTVVTLSSISGRAALILAGIFFGIGWYCAYLKGFYEASGFRLSDKDRPSIKYTFIPVFAWFGFVLYVLADWDPSRQKTFESDGMSELVAQSIAIPFLIALLVHTIATTYKHSQAMDTKRHLDRLEEARKHNR